jgi:hypothetical protein
MRKEEFLKTQKSCEQMTSGNGEKKFVGQKGRRGLRMQRQATVS